MTRTIFHDIVETKRGEVIAARRVRPITSLQSACAAAPPPRDFHAAVVDGAPPIRLIAELKKASPSAGLLQPDYRPAELARAYESAGAAALSVLTDQTYFKGCLDDLAAARSAVALPALRKDFIVDEYQVYEARAAGADAILLIAEVLDLAQLDAFSRIAASLGMASLIEVHDAAKACAVLPLISPGRRTILGINNRDLHAQKTDVNTARRIAAGLPKPGGGTMSGGRPIPFVAESGLQTRADVAAMAACGACAVLIGETLLRTGDPAAKIRELMGR